MIKLFDTYTIRARLYPAFIVLSPVIILVIFSYYEYLKIIQIIFAFFTMFGFTFLIAQFARERGKNKEAKLWAGWGGKPTTQYLRYRSSYIDETTRNRYFKKLSELMNIKMPTEQEEKENPTKVDDIYDGCAKYLISNTRDKEKYNLLFLENINYGFRRNMWGMKTIAILIIISSTIGIIIQKSKLEFSNYEKFYQSDVIIPLLIYFFLSIMWLTLIKSIWVKDVAFEYSRRLYETLDRM